MPRKIINTDKAPAAIGTYSQAVRVGATVYLSGQIPLVPATMQLRDGDMRAHITQVFESLKAVAPRLAERLARLGIHCVQDVLFHLPARYQDRTRVVPIGALRPGDEAVIEGEVQLTELRYGKRPALLSRISDGTGSLTLRFFHFNAKQRDALQRGVRLRCYGEARVGPVTLEMVHPEYRPVAADEGPDAAGAGETLTPIYPTTEGLHQLSLRNLTDQALAHLADDATVADWLPAELVNALRLPALAAALHYVHRPPVDAPVEQLLAGRHPAQQRLAFEELLAHH